MFGFSFGEGFEQAFKTRKPLISVCDVTNFRPYVHFWNLRTNLSSSCAELREFPSLCDEDTGKTSSNNKVGLFHFHKNRKRAEILKHRSSHEI